MGPLDVFRTAARLVLAKDMAGFTALFAEDGVLEFPFAPPGRPREVSGPALRDYLIDYPSRLDPREVTDITVHETADPDVAVVELTVTGVVTATGRPYELRYVCVLTVRDGLIVRYRDYWNPLALAELLDGSREAS
jgi:ketosteroid isomerase-like protein